MYVSSTARIFVYVQVSVWLLFLTFSILLIVGAAKVRPDPVSVTCTYNILGVKSSS